MFGEPVVIVRDRERKLHALINVCQHRHAQIVDDGAGNAKLFVCPFHRWTYNLDGSLRGVSVEPIPGFDKKSCRMPSLALEEWQGFIFINFDQDAQPLAPQLSSVEPIFNLYGVDKYRHEQPYDFESPFNWKLNFEAGYEGYHHAGLHNERFNHIEPAGGSRTLWFGEICGSYGVPFADNIPVEETRPFGLPPHLEEGAPRETDTYIYIYPCLMMYLNSFQVTYSLVQHKELEMNIGSTPMSFAPWTYERPGAKEIQKEWMNFTVEVQKEDSYGCTMMQKGLRSKTNTRGVIHPLEIQMSHYHNWYLDQFLEA
jgi:nitrite reductase/ring-hydroxylating ferredoxin subunit